MWPDSKLNFKIFYKLNEDGRRRLDRRLLESAVSFISPPPPPPSPRWLILVRAMNHLTHDELKFLNNLINLNEWIWGHAIDLTMNGGKLTQPFTPKWRRSSLIESDTSLTAQLAALFHAALGLDWRASNRQSTAGPMKTQFLTWNESLCASRPNEWPPIRLLSRAKPMQSRIFLKNYFLFFIFKTFLTCQDLRTALKYDT